MRSGVSPQRPHPLQAIVVSFPLALFASVIPADVAYLQTAEIQWSNFSAWLIVGGLLTGAPTLAWAIVDIARTRRRRAIVIVLLWLAMFVTGLINILLHSRDAWYSVTGTGLFLSVLTSALAIAAAWLTFSAGQGDSV
jgi:uncharacterized membrane protein